MRYELKIILWHIFYLVFFLTLALFFWGDGHGSSIPLAVLFAPFLTKLYTPAWSNSQGASILFQMPLYCLILWMAQKKNLSKKSLLILPIIHFLLAAKLVLFSDLDGHRHYYWFCASTLFMYPYWHKYFSLLQHLNKNEKRKEENSD